MNREEFDKVYFGKAVHCDTEEKANEFLALADSVGYKWITKRKLIGYSQWERYKEETCYELTDMGFVYGNVEYFKNDNYDFIEYQLRLLPVGDLEKTEEPTYKEETIDDIIEEINHHQKSINVLLNRLERKVKVGK